MSPGECEAHRLRPPPPLEGPLQQPYRSPPPLLQDQPPKMLQSLLYSQLSSSSSSSGSSSSSSTMYASSPSSSFSSSYGNLLTPRARSGSLGSTGSSIRDSSSPGHESTSSQETMSRGSPMSVGSSPSPSPPVTDSKLLGILRGSVSPQYAHLLLDSPRSVTASPTLSERALTLKRSHSEQNEPIDLSFKTKKQKMMPGSSSSSSSSSSRRSSSSSSSSSSTTNSILESVLSGKSHLPSGRQNWFCDNAKDCEDGSHQAGAASVDSYLNTRSSVPSNQKVGLAKKTIPPVHARVQDWLVKIVQLAKLQPEFVRLPHSDKVTLMLNAWPRILLLHMAENNFQFVVTPVHHHHRLHQGVGAATETADNGSDMASSSSAVPTMAHVEAIQNLISKCQSMNLDQKEYQYIRKSALFHSGYDGLENADYIDDVNTYIRDDLQVHIRNSRPSEKLRYSNILLCMHTLFGINTKVVDVLFCVPRANGRGTEQLLKNLLLEA